MPFTTLLAGQLFVLQKMTQDQILRLKLFSNDRTPSRNDSAGLYNEVIHPDYTTKLLTPSEWVYQIDHLTGDYVATFAEQIWTFNAPITVYGYMIANNLGNTVLFAERFPNAPIVMDGFNGKKIKVTPTLGVR